MNCKNCGTPLMGMEHACPVCGAPLPTPQPNPMQAVDPALAAMPQQMASAPPQMMPGGAPPMGLPQEPVPQEEPKKPNNIFAILLLLVAFAAIGVGVFLALTDKEEETVVPENTPVEQQEETPAPAPVPKSDVAYAGYNFAIPTDYQTNVDGNYGLVIRTGDVIYTILVDYTNSYNAYKQQLEALYPDQAATMTTTVAGKEFLIPIVTDASNSHQGTQFVTKADENTSFVGLAVKKDFVPVTITELGEVYEMTNSATKQTEVAAGSPEDGGKAGYVDFINQFTSSHFVFQ